jgi:hypothetical protein
MENQDLIRVIVKNCKITSLYGLLIFVFSLTTFLIIGGTLMLILGQICMSVFSSLTSVMGRQASVSQSTLLASRYASWSLINLIIWGGVGAYSSYIEVWILVLFTPPSVSIPVSLIWFALYLSGLLLYIRFLKVSKIYRESVVQHQLAGDNPDVPPGQRAQAYQSGYQGGLQPGYQSGYQPGYQPVQQPYPQGQAVNYFAPGSNVYYGSPMNNNPVGK